MKIVCSIAITFLACLPGSAQNAGTNSFTQTNLVSDIPGMALSTDSHLINPWGLSLPASPTAKEDQWWASDQGTGVSTLYYASGSVAQLVVTIPSASGTGPGSPTGTVAYNSNFVFVTLDGTISQWLISAGPPRAKFDHLSAPSQPCSNCHTTTAVLKVNNASKGTSYTGCTVAKNNGQSQLYTAGPAGVEAYDVNFAPVTLGAGAFTDPNVPAGYSPYGIQSVGSRLYVTFSPPPPATGGYVDAFDSTGKLQLTLQSGTWFDEPWGIAQAPSAFGAFPNAVLVGNTGSGKIAAFNRTSGKFLGFLKDSNGQPIANPGLWALYFGNGNADAGPTTTLYFNAGIQNFTHGLFGALTAN